MKIHPDETRFYIQCKCPEIQPLTPKDIRVLSFHSKSTTARSNSSYRPTSRDPLYQDAMELAATDVTTFGGI
ncbi:hypothetical protein TNCV_1173701 [Trichonephila clavipes]|uniref:Uncharacterized protein n=1 Tax=Trichonephila clavipes TaxID=2585209 RepID=A0A8X6VDG1_TRICX|nr:hypothetical protein TNCV_1173701 [Trichonephila clavipes]